VTQEFGRENSAEMSCVSDAEEKFNNVDDSCDFCGKSFSQKGNMDEHRDQCHKTLYIRNYIFVIRWSVCPWQAFPTYLMFVAERCFTLAGSGRTCKQKTSGLYYKSFIILFYDRKDSGQY